MVFGIGTDSASVASWGSVAVIGSDIEGGLSHPVFSLIPGIVSARRLNWLPESRTIEFLGR